MESESESPPLPVAAARSGTVLLVVVGFHYQWQIPSPSQTEAAATGNATQAERCPGRTRTASGRPRPASPDSESARGPRKVESSVATASLGALTGMLVTVTPAAGGEARGQGLAAADDSPPGPDGRARRHWHRESVTELPVELVTVSVVPNLN